MSDAAFNFALVIFISFPLVWWIVLIIREDGKQEEMDRRYQSHMRKARASAIAKLKARLTEINAAPAAIGAHTEAEEIALKATQDLAKAEADCDEKLDK